MGIDSELLTGLLIQLLNQPKEKARLNRKIDKTTSMHILGTLQH